MKSCVMITGAAGGLGKAFAAECAARGWDLFLTDVSGQALSAVAAGLERLYGVTVTYTACDLTDPAAREALWQAVDQAGLRFHFLINVAGLDYEGLFEERRVDELHTILRLNIEATVEMTRRVLEHRDPARTLHIITVSSLAAFYPMPVKAVYAASKRFLLDWSLALREELRGADATVMALCPAGMPTNPACIRAIDAQGFMGRITTMNVGDVAAAAVNHALVGRALYIPGAVNRALRLLGGLMPAPAAAGLIGRRWMQSHQQAHADRPIPSPAPAADRPPKASPALRAESSSQMV
ncbi:MAG: hypothetical protein Kow00124_10170 [Anaerolineae bacterium]